MVLMFVAGGILWLNVREQPSDTYSLTSDGPKEKPWRMKIKTYGWPLAAFTQHKPVSEGADANELPRTGHFISNPLLLINAGIGLSILLAVWYLCEWQIRQRATRTGA
jgi:hypothetical protein